MPTSQSDVIIPRPRIICERCHGDGHATVTCDQRERRKAERERDEDALRVLNRRQKTLRYLYPEFFATDEET